LGISSNGFPATILGRVGVWIAEKRGAASVGFSAPDFFGAWFGPSAIYTFDSRWFVKWRDA
jgi:hypothetical protein